MSATKPERKAEESVKGRSLAHPSVVLGRAASAGGAGVRAGKNVSLPIADEAVAVPAERVRGCCAPLRAGPFTEDDQLQVLADLEALAHPIRLRLLAALAANPGRVCVCDLEAIVPVKQPTVSHHLRILREAGLVDSERDGLWAHYRIRREAVAELSDRVGLALAHLLRSEAMAEVDES